MVVGVLYMSFLSSVFSRTKEDEEAEEDQYYLAKDRDLKRRRATSGKGDEREPERRRRPHRSHHRHGSRHRNGQHDDDEDNYVERSQRRREQNKDSVPYLHGPQEDSNPIIDYIIKSHKYGHKRDGKAKKVGSDALSQVIMGTRAYNAAADEAQIDGAWKELARAGHHTQARPVLLSQRLSIVAAQDVEAAKAAAAVDAGGSSSGSGRRCWPEPRAKRDDRPRCNPDSSMRWAHDRFEDARRSRSRSRSRSWGRSRSRERQEPRARRGHQESRNALEDWNNDEDQVPRERPSPVYA